MSEPVDDTSELDTVTVGDHTLSAKEYESMRSPSFATTRDHGQTFAGAVEALLPSAYDPARLLDWELVPTSFFSVACRYGRKLGDGSACTPLSPEPGYAWPVSVPATAQRLVEEPHFSRVSYSSDYMARKPADTPSLPWYGFSDEDETNERYGVWSRGTSKLMSHEGHLLTFQGSRCLLRMLYLRPRSTQWRVNTFHPFHQCCLNGKLDQDCLPEWLQHALGNQTSLHAPGILYSADGKLPDRNGERRMHVSIYYSTATSDSWNGLACIGRISGVWNGTTEACEPRFVWEDDGQPVLCSNSALSITIGGESVANVGAGPKFKTKEDWVAGSDDEAMAYGSEPFYGFDGSLYMVYGAREPGDVRVVQLNESNGRLPKIAQPGESNVSLSPYHTVARGPSFELTSDSRSTTDFVPAYLSGKVRPMSDSVSLARNPFILPVERNGTKQYFLFVEWFGDGDRPGDSNESLSRIYVGRSEESPLGPFKDRIGNRLDIRSKAILGDERTISIVSAAWGANCDGVGYDVTAVAKLKCEAKPACNWTLAYGELDPIDPHSYPTFELASSTQSSAVDTSNLFANGRKCPRAMSITYRCTKKAAVLYEGEELGEELHVQVDGEAANGSVATLTCHTPRAVEIPGGSLFADPQRLGANLHFRTVSHPGVFAYTKYGESVYVFTFQYHTARSSLPELGARRIRFAADGWPILADDHTANWAKCIVPEATYDHQAPTSYFDVEAHYNAAHNRQAHYTSSSSTRTHCSHHSRRGTHCVGNSLRATHPQLGTSGSEGSLLHGRIEESGTASYWREQADHCNPLYETQLGRPLVCTRFAGRGDLNPSRHVSTMERIRGCPQLACKRRFPCRRDRRTRATTGTLDSCTDGLACKKLPQLHSESWDPSDFFVGGRPLEITRDGPQICALRDSTRCDASPVHISRINPALGEIHGGTTISVHGTGFDDPARCRFGWVEVPAENITAQLVLCRAPALNETFSETSVMKQMKGVRLQQLLRHPLTLEISVMSKKILEGAPLTAATREARGENFTMDRHAFQFYDRSKIFVSFIRPQGGPTSGSTPIDVHGSGFWPSDKNSNVKCRFTFAGRQAIMPATYHNSERISCTSPVQESNGVSSLDVTFNEQEYTGANITFTFITLQNHSQELDGQHVEPNVIISRIQPLGGPARGGTMLTLYGVGFQALGAPSKAIESFANQAWHKLSAGENIRLSERPGAGVQCLIATDAKIGELRGTFGPLDSIAGYLIGSDRVICEMPSYRFDPASTNTYANATVDLTFNDNEHERTASDHLFSYYRDDTHVQPKLHAVRPYGGPTTGGTILTIYSSLLRRLTAADEAPICRFGGAELNMTVPGTISTYSHDEQVVRCVSPAVIDQRALKDVALNVAQNGQDFVRRPLRFNYYAVDKLAIHELQPHGGPIDGGTMVLLRGRHIGASRGGLQCIFGNVNVPGTAANENSLRCISPPHSMLPNETSAYVTQRVRVTINGDLQAASLSAGSFTYFAPLLALSISSIYPQAGTSSGGVAVTIHGKAFRDLGGVFCRFGASLPVMAQAPPPPPPPRPAPGIDGDLRLANGGPGGLQGRVEVYHNGTWGTVCDDFWEIEDARTVCKQLGFADASSAVTGGFYGPGSGPIWLDNVNCVPGTMRLDECGSMGWGVHNCDHHEDAGVICLPQPNENSPSSPPASPPPPLSPWTRLDDFQLMRSREGAHIDCADISFVDMIGSFNVSEMQAFVCRAPALDEALGKHEHRAIVKTVELSISINGQTYGIGMGQNFTYYHA